MGAAISSSSPPLISAGPLASCFLSLKENSHFPERRVGPNLFPKLTTFHKTGRPKAAFTRHIPIVQSGAPGQTIARPSERTMRSQIVEMIFHEQQSWPMPLQVESAQHIELCPFDIHRDKVDFRIAGFDQDSIEGHHLHHFCSNVISSRIDKVFDQSRMARAFGSEKGHFRRASGAPQATWKT